MLHLSFKRASLIALTLAAASGCGAFQTKEKTRKQKQTDTSLAGAWRTSCVKGDLVGLSHETDDLKFSLVGDFDRTTTLFTGDGCQNAAVELTTRGTFDTLGKATKIDGADEINLTIAEATVTPRSDDAVKLLSDVSYCGVRDWQRNAAVNVLDKDCAGKDIRKGEVIFDVYKLENDNKRLLLGKGSFWSDKSDAGSRPEKLDNDRAYDKR